MLEMIARLAVERCFVPALGFEAACFASPAARLCADLFLIPACVFCVHHLRRRPMPGSRPKHQHYPPGPRLRHSHT